MLELKQISLCYGQQPALQALSLAVTAGETLALLGPSGCGKTTLLKVIAGLLSPDSGQVICDGEDITGQPSERRRFAMMFQDFALFSHLNVLENVMFGLIERHIPRREAAAQAQQALAQVGLADYAGRRVQALSGGEQQRVALARALVIQPRLLLLDEPFSSLDAALRGRLQREFGDLLRGQRITTILVTHDRHEAFHLADRIALLHQGRIVQCATPDEILQRPVNAWAARFVGFENVLDDGVLPQQAFRLGADQPAATIRMIERGADGARLRVATEQGEFVLRLSARELAQLGALVVGGTLLLGVDWSAKRLFAENC